MLCVLLVIFSEMGTEIGDGVYDCTVANVKFGFIAVNNCLFNCN